MIAARSSRGQQGGASPPLLVLHWAERVGVFVQRCSGTRLKDSGVQVRRCAPRCLNALGVLVRAQTSTWTVGSEVTLRQESATVRQNIRWQPARSTPLGVRDI